jgi:diaminopimelate epimerase
MAKLEAAGNDFLVLSDFLDRPGPSLTPAQIRALCDRRRGVGADGLIVGRRARRDADLEMVLHNADGSEAETSGNGIRCLVHAAVGAGVVAPGIVRVATGAGVRTVAYRPGTDGEAWAQVDMGPVRLLAEVTSPLPGTRARLADVGNPHLVVVGDVDLDALDLAPLGPAAAEAAGRPVNVEVVRRGGAGAPGGAADSAADLELRVLERGVGETLACGTGSCAAAAVARAFGMTGDTVTVENPGGRLWVRLGATTRPGGGSGARPEAVVDGVELGGPVRKVADVEVDAALLGAADHEGA